MNLGHREFKFLLDARVKELQSKEGQDAEAGEELQDELEGGGL